MLKQHLVLIFQRKQRHRRWRTEALQNWKVTLKFAWFDPDMMHWMTVYVCENWFTENKPDVKDLRSNPPAKIKLPFITKPSPPPVKDKPNKVLPKWVYLSCICYIDFFFKPRVKRVGVWGSLPASTSCHIALKIQIPGHLTFSNSVEMCHE